MLRAHAAGCRVRSPRLHQRRVYLKDKTMTDVKALNRTLKEFPGNKYYRVYIDTGAPHDLSETSLELHAITGCYADEYILPVTAIDNIFTVISDESTFKGHSCVSLVVMAYADANQKIKECEPLLESLCDEYQLSNIHFTDIIGRNSLGGRRNDFLQRYGDIVSDEKMWAVSFSVNRSDFLHKLSFENVSDSELYFILFWNVMEFIAEALPAESVFHLYFEQENNLSITLSTDYMSKLHDGINQCESLLERHCSISRHPLFFSKQALLFSSISDLAVYSNNILQQKLDAGVPVAKILKNHNVLIGITKRVFKSYTSLHQSKQGAADLVISSDQAASV
jgi:hypothetical protein